MKIESHAKLAKMVALATLTPLAVLATLDATLRAAPLYPLHPHPNAVRNELLPA